MCSLSTSGEPDLKQIANDFATAFRTTDERPHAQSIALSGWLPHELRGSCFFRLGPGKLCFSRQTHDQSISHAHDHPLEGDGLLTKWSFAPSGTSLCFSSRFVRTHSFNQEHSIGQPEYPTIFASPPTSHSQSPLSRLLRLKHPARLKNLANTAVQLVDGKLFAMFDSGLPYCIDPRSLHTLPNSPLANMARGNGWLKAHARTSPDNRRIFYSFDDLSITPTATFYELSPEDSSLLRREHFFLPLMLPFTHDLVVTQNWYILFQTPTRLRLSHIIAYLRGRIAMMDLFKTGEQAWIHLLPRGSTGSRRERVAIPVRDGVRSCFHHCNAFERDGLVILDTVGYGNFSFDNMRFSKLEQPEHFFNGEDGQRADVWRFVLDPGKKIVCESHVLSHRSVELPATHPERMGHAHRFIFCAASAIADKFRWSPPQCVYKVDTENPQQSMAYQPLARGFVGEPVLVPKRDKHGESLATEDALWLICMVYNAESGSTEVHVLDAEGEQMREGPLCIAKLGFYSPLDLHTLWVGPEQAEKLGLH